MNEETYGMIFPASFTREQMLAALIGNVHTTPQKLNALKDTLTEEQLDWLMDLLRNCSTRCYKQGYEDGLTNFAWWKDGEQFVGTCGTTLKDAIRYAFKSSSYNPNINWLTDEIKCPVCNGSGCCNADVCPACDGRGKKRNKQ
jgi:hypothetical protein